MATSDAPLNVPNVTLAVARGSTPPAATGDPLVRFDFANGDTLASASINQTGFTFDANPRTIEAAPNGQLGVKFPYGGTVAGDAWEELRYEIGAQLFETYERIMLWIPSNFEHRYLLELEVAAGTTLPNWQKGDVVQTSSGDKAFFHGIADSGAQTFMYVNYPTNRYAASFVGTLTNTTRGLTVDTLARNYLGSNNKFSAQWAGVYGPTGDPNKHGGLIVEYIHDEEADFFTNPPPSYFKVLPLSAFNGNSSGNIKPFTGTLVTPPGGTGLLRDVVIRRRRSSGELANDGICEIWIDGVLELSVTNINSWSPTNNYLERGYILGYSNSGFFEDTTFYVTKFELYDDTAPEGITLP